MSIFEEFRSYTKLFDDFRFYDEQEHLRKIKIANIQGTSPPKFNQHQRDILRSKDGTLSSQAFMIQPFNFDDAFPENKKKLTAPIGALPFGASPMVKNEKDQRAQMAEKKRELM